MIGAEGAGAMGAGVEGAGATGAGGVVGGAEGGGTALMAREGGAEEEVIMATIMEAAADVRLSQIIDQ